MGHILVTVFVEIDFTLTNNLAVTPDQIRLCLSHKSNHTAEENLSCVLNPFLRAKLAAISSIILFLVLFFYFTVLFYLIFCFIISCF